jgi:hypothetical protein
MLIGIAGHDCGFGDFSFIPGDVVELPEPIAKAWIEGGHAKPVEVQAAPPAKSKKKPN